MDFHILPLFFLTALFFLNFTVRIVLSPLLPTISEDMGLTRDQAGGFFLISASGYFIALICSGFISHRFLHKKTIVLSAVGSGLAMIGASLSPDLPVMRLMIFLSGMASALYLPSGMAILTGSISSQNWGKAIGVHELAPNLSFLLAPVICEGLLLLMTWRNVLACIGGASILMGISFWRFSKVRDFRGEPPMIQSLLPLLATPSFWLMIALFSVGVTGTLGMYAMLPLFLVREHGLLQAEANTLMTLSRLLTLPMPFAAGWLSDRFGLKPALAVILLTTGILTLLTGVFSGPFIKAVILVQPLAAVCFFPPAFAALSRIGSEKTRNISISFTIPVAFLVGGGVVPKLIGIAGENHLFSLGFVLAGAWILTGALLPFFLNLRKE